MRTLKSFFFIFFCLVPLCISAQLEVDSSGDTYFYGNVYMGSTSNLFSTTNNVPITFKVNSVLAGFTGGSVNYSVSFGYGALNSSQSSFRNTAIGYYALYKNTGGSYNSANGAYALYGNTTGTNNTANGYFALYSNETGGSNTACGGNALYLNTTGNHNTAMGLNALYSNTGSYNTASGSSALKNNTTGTNNTASGNFALYSNKTGSYNNANGAYALYSTTGSYNSANGAYALYSNTSGSYNNANGTNALYSNTSGNYNTATGHKALYNFNTTGITGCNTAHGANALYSNTTGSCNTAIGYYADVSSGALTNATAIGYNAKANTSNQIRIGNSSITSIIGGSSFTIMSDGRTKKNIRAEVPGLAFINQLQPVMYNFDLNAIDELQKSDDPKINAFRDSVLMARSPEEKEIETKARVNKEKIVYSGFIAQDVEVAARSVGYDFSGVDAPENGKGVYGLRYAEFVVPLVKAVQELSEQNERLMEAMKEQQGIIDELKQNIERLEENTLVINLRSDTGENTVTDLSDTAIEQCKLYQNAPNPFSVNTEIKYFLTTGIANAKLYIYDMQGKQIKSLPIIQRGEGLIQIQGSELSAGMYIYTLIADNKVVDTKRMILTE